MNIRHCLGSLRMVAAVIAACAALGNACGQTLIGSPGAGWQTWTVANLNDNSHPYWDAPWGSTVTATHNLAEKNPGFCITSTGDCQGIGSAILAPGAIPFWGLPYDASADTGGERDNAVYFKSAGHTLIATLVLNASVVKKEINEFGWFETNSTGSVIGARHILFQGTGEPPGSQPATPVGKSVKFMPSKYFGYYYSDVSEPSTTPAPTHGCYAYTLFNFNEPACLQSGGAGDHDLVVFSANAASEHPTYWIVGEDPADCSNNDGDCNLTIVKVRRAGM